MRANAIFIGTLAALLLGACDESTPEGPAEPASVPAAAKTTPSTDDPPKAEASHPTTPKRPAGSAEPAEPPIPPSGHAVVRVGGRLFTASTGEAGVELPPLGPGASAPAGLAVKVVGERDGRIEVETLLPSTSSEPTHCAGSLSALGDFRLRFHVTPDDLLDVVTEEFTHSFEDDTSIRLMPGTPVLPGEPTTVSAGRTRVQVPVPAKARGRYYEPRPLLSDEGSKGHLYDWDGPAPTYDGNRPLAEDGLFRPLELLDHYGATKRGTNALVTVRGECLEATVTVSAKRLTPRMPGVMIGMMPNPESTGTPSGSGAVWPVETGTPILWSDGRPAGQVAAAHTFSTEPESRGGNSCFEVPLTAEPMPTVMLCFAPSDISRSEATAAPSLSPSVGSGSGGSKVEASDPDVKGALDKAAIQTVVRSHLDEVRDCYQTQLTKDPSLAGMVSIQFTIGPTGKVPLAVVAESTVEDEEVGKCVLGRVKRWVFPAPKGGGNAIATYPFVFAPS